MLKWVSRLALLFLPAAAFAQTGTIQGYCDQGGVSAAVSGLPSTNKLQGVIPSCTITVYLTGTTTLATIFRDGSSTPLSNPFTANAVGSLLPGHFIFWAALGTAYDVTGKSGIAPNVYPQTVPLLTDVFASSSGGGGTSLCGPLAGDNSSTDCGFGNRVGDNGPNPESASSFGSGNLTNNGAFKVTVVGTNNALNQPVGGSNGNIVAVGDSNFQTVATGGLADAYAQNIAIGDRNGNTFAGNEMILMGDANGNDFSGDSSIGIGIATLNNLLAGSNHIVALGDGAASDTTATVIFDAICLGDGPCEDVGGDDFVAIGDGSLSGPFPSAATGLSDIVAVGDAAVTHVGSNSDNIVGIGDSVARSLGASSSDVIAIGHNVNGTASATLTNAIGIGEDVTLASNTTVIGNSSTTSLKLFGCPTGQSVLDDGSGTCYVPGSGGSGGTNVSVNGGSTLASANLSNTTPSPGATDINVLWQNTGSNVSAEVPFATSSTFGVIKPDGTSCTVAAGVLTCPGSGGAVSSVANSDGTLTISPTTGAVVASLALGHANTWTGVQTFVAPVLGTITSGVGTALTALNGSNISSGTVAAARLPLFGTSAAGIVPLSGGGTTNFLRADGTWAAPPGGGSCPGGSTGNLQYNSSGACAGDASTNDDGSGNLTATSYSGTGTKQAALALGVGTGAITSALPTNYAGWIGPASGTPAYFAVLPNANPTTPGIMILGSAATVNAVQQAPVTTLAGTTTTVLHGNVAGAPTYAAVSLTADVAGVLPTGNGGNNTSSPSFAAQTDAATVTWAIASALIANASLTFTTHGGSRALNLTGLVNGGSYVIWLKQDATGGEGLTLGTGCTWKVGGGGSGAVALSSAANAIDVLAFTYDGTNCYANFNTNFN